MQGDLKKIFEKDVAGKNYSQFNTVCVGLNSEGLFSVDKIHVELYGGIQHRNVLPYSN